MIEKAAGSSLPVLPRLKDLQLKISSQHALNSPRSRYRVYIVSFGCMYIHIYWGYIGIKEKKIESTTLGLVGTTIQAVPSDTP